MLYSVQKLADKSGIPPSTARYWLVNLFKEFAPPRQNGKWPDEALEIIIQIKELKNQQLDNEDVRDELRKTKAETVEEQPRALTTPATQEYYQENLQMMQAMLANQQKHLELLEKLVLKVIGEDLQKTTKKGTTKKTPKKPARKVTRKRATPKKKTAPKRKPPKRKPAKKTFWQTLTGQ